MLEVFENILENNATAHPLKEGDYKKDGLWHCGVCHEPRQVKLQHYPKGIPVFFPFVDCACERAAKEKAEREHKEELRQWDIKNNIRRCFQNPDQRKHTFANDDGKSSEVMLLAKSYCENFAEIRQRDKHRGLLLFGPTGSGKSYIACAICNDLLGQGYACRIVTIPELTNNLQREYDKNAYLDELCDIDLLVLDDFGVQRNTSTANEQLFEIINHILLARVPIIVTTNMSNEELKNPGDINLQRITSRLFELCFPYKVDGVDRRKTALRDDYRQMSELLGLNDTPAKKHAPEIKGDEP